MSIVEVRDLTMGWDATILQKNATFAIERGEVFGILGGSGCGKSTLLRHLTGLEEPMSGEIEIEGLGKPRLEGERPAYGVMFQSGALLGSMTLAENVALPLERWTDLPDDAIEAIVLSKLRLVGLEGTDRKFPSELSGGMKKRGAIARALALEPELIFLDEPSAGLDPITSAELDDLISSLNRAFGITFVVVTHELPSIFQIVDRCILLDRDSQSIIADGAPRELQKSSEDPRVYNFFNRKTEAK